MTMGERDGGYSRRAVLRAMAAGSTVGLAGCATAEVNRVATTSEPTPGVAAPSNRTVDGVELPVSGSEMYAALAKDTIPAIVEPAFGADWSDVETPEGEPAELPDDSPVIGVHRGGRARAYPLRILDWHEVVNDRLGGPLFVSYCVLCGSAVVAERTVDGTATVFGVSGYLWRDDLVLYDRLTESLWSQLLATAIQGPLTGTQLSLVPSSFTTWAEWRSIHPETEVLLPPPASNTVEGREATFDYFTPKYSFDEGQLIGYDREEDGVTPRTLVIGVEAGGVARAYPFQAVETAGVVNDRVGGLPVVVTVTPGGSLAAYDRRVDGRVRTFSVEDESHLRAGGSLWERATGLAVDGRYEGQRLESASEFGPMFWRGWKNFNPESAVYGQSS